MIATKRATIDTKYFFIFIFVENVNDMIFDILNATL